MPAILTRKAKLYPVWMASRGNKFVVAQAQEDAIDAFKVHYGEPPSIVINGLYAAKLEAKDVWNNDRRGGVGEG